MSDYVQQLLRAGRIPDCRKNTQLLYLVITVNRTAPPPAAGFHWFDTFEGHPFRYAWSSSLSHLTVSHEIVEACTDPEGSGFFDSATGEEIADVCGGGLDSDGIFAEAYWSAVDGKCIVPRRTVRITVSQATADDCRIGPQVGGLTTFGLVFGVEPNWIDSSDLPVLQNPQFTWTFDPNVAASVSSTGDSKLILQWKAPSTSATVVSVKITTAQGIELKALVSLVVHDDSQAQLLARLCQLRKYLGSITKTQPYLVDPLGPDFARLPSGEELQQLRSTVQHIQQELEHVTALSRSMGLDG